MLAPRLTIRPICPISEMSLMKNVDRDWFVYWLVLMCVVFPVKLKKEDVGWFTFILFLCRCHRYHDIYVTRSPFLEQLCWADVSLRHNVIVSMSVTCHKAIMLTSIRCKMLLFRRQFVAQCYRVNVSLLNNVIVVQLEESYWDHRQFVCAIVIVRTIVKRCTVKNLRAVLWILWW